jgi:hypothetical protein
MLMTTRKLLYMMSEHLYEKCSRIHRYEYPCYFYTWFRYVGGGSKYKESYRLQGIASTSSDFDEKGS